ncbi:hypothetical protein [Hoeflea poritis]|uniref:Uncharacterized protein n=1 Tax=Hoeflea poritis TaxID=2993659 RepID=A0ABT4VMF4_9HYPH|nr:hypothetical protein [Hoeflea poritis]MDA4845228.1 hypothetical protein [Hoeflea poritis]
MNLLLDRDQNAASIFSLIPLRVGSGVTFTLHATLELDQEEEALLQKYNLTKAPLVISDPIEDLKQSFRPALFLGLITFVVIWFIASFSTALGLAILVTLVMTGVYFKTLREQIIVSELLTGGRKFRCDSIVALIEKEAYLEYICGFLRQVLESAKHWHDREALPIPPLKKEEAKQAVLKALHR